jgi:nitrate reductase NapD
MNVSSLVIRARPERCGDVRAALEQMAGVEVRAATAAGQLVVVADHHDTGAAADSFVAIHKIEGVLSVSLVYQFSDDSDSVEEV